MASTQQTQAINNANTVMALASQLLALYNQIKIVNAAWSDDNSLTTLQAMQTVVQNADGTLGTTDATPNNTHPLNTNTYTGLNRAISASQLASILTQLNNIVSFIDGGALAATPGVHSVLNGGVG